MSTIQIVGKEYYLKHIFGDGFRFFIPRYQRPYAWTTEETEDLLDDLWTAYTTSGEPVEKRDPYFLGSIVLIKEEHQPRAEVIDGQQRITTLTILLSVLRTLQAADGDDLARYLYQKGIKFEGTEDEFRLTLRPKDAEFFEKYIQKEGGISSLEKLNPGGLRNDAQRNIRANALYLLRKLKDKSATELASFTQYVVTKCLLVVVSTPDMESAYRIFSVMNDRGLDLSHADILKAEIIGQIEGDQKQDAYGKKWETAEENLGREAFDDLFAHIRMIQVKQKLRNTILKEIREHVKPGEQPEKFIDEQLVPYADALEIVKDADYQSAEGAEKVNAYLKWLNRIDNFDWIPPAIVALAKHQGQPRWLGRFFQQLERLAAGMMVMRAGINDRLERYGKVLDAIEGGDDVALDARMSLTEKEKRKIRERLDSNLYELTKVRAYVLLRLDTALSGGGAVYNYPIITIEHVLPQTPQKASQWMEWFPEESQREAWTHRIGNLVLLSRKKNSEAQNYDFATKKEKYFKSDKGVSPFVLTTQVLGENEWTPALLEMRQESLLAKLVEIWSLESWGTEEDERDADGSVEEGSASVSKDKKPVPERYDIRERFWTGLLEVAKEKTALHAKVSPGQYNWVGAGSGTRGLGFNYAVREHGTQVELYIDRGKDSDAENQRIFEELVGRREEVEAAFGDTLEWQRLDGRRACRIRYVIDVGGYRDPEKWAEIHEVSADAMARLEKAMKPAIQDLGL
jgi:hypothetical protein